ncbi:MAG: NAD(+)/NADH kinase [Bacteroidota bacterium]|nr:NAD(+)/NADH kinase [Bacteroidota bacterium]
MKFGIIGNIHKPTLSEVVIDLISYFREKKIDFVVSDDVVALLGKLKRYNFKESNIASSKALPANCDVLIAFGGDGTMLAAARIVGKQQTPILGINLGKLGFLADVTITEMKKSIQSIIDHNYLIENRIVLEASSNVKKKKYFGLNDIVIDRGNYKRVIELETYVNGQFLVRYSADGLIITTPTGSTAYSLAAGGPVVTPGTDVFVITPIAAHTLTARPVVVPDNSIIKVIVKTDVPIHLSADGQEEAFFKTPVEFIIRRASYQVKLIKRKEHSYFELLRTKLLWGRDIRTGK